MMKKALLLAFYSYAQQEQGITILCYCCWYNICSTTNHCVHLLWLAIPIWKRLTVWLMPMNRAFTYIPAANKNCKKVAVTDRRENNQKATNYHYPCIYSR